ncbi:MAG: SDR family oxidoreductase [Alphaproteobacteria bacterium]
MQVKDAVAFVTGANGEIGRALVQALLDAGAARVYAAARDPAALEGLVRAGGGRVVPITLDVTRDADVAAAAGAAPDTTLLVNNAGINSNTRLFAEPDIGKAEREMAVNYFGTLRTTRAFAPVLKANGGGCIVNMLSILARCNLPIMATYCASKAALLSLTQATRAELAGQGTAVIGMMPGAVATHVTAHLDIPKMTTAEMAAAILAAVEAGEEDSYPGGMAQGVSAGLAADPKGVEREFAASVKG